MTIFKCFRADNCLKPIKEVQNLLKITPEGRYPKDSFQRYVFKCFRAYNCVKSIKEVQNLLKKVQFISWYMQQMAENHTQRAIVNQTRRTVASHKLFITVWGSGSERAL